MRRFLFCVAFVGSMTACSDVQMLGATAIEQRKVMNDMQARATMAAVCDLSIGAYFRELNETERQLSGLVCGGPLQASSIVTMGMQPGTVSQPLMVSPSLFSDEGSLLN